MAAYMNVPLNVPRKNKYYQIIKDHTLDPNFSDEDIFKKYRFTREGIDYVTEIVRGDIESNNNFGRPIQAKVQVMATLRYLGSASLQLSVADTLGISQASVSRCVDRVCTSLYSKMDELIVWPQNINSAKMEFYAVGGFPGVVGVINRHYYPSINVCAVCDAEQRFTFASIKWPGCCHDSFILRQTNLWDLYEDNRLSGIVLGDSGYACRNWLLTPYLNPVTPAQEAFNGALKRTRVLIECSFGRLKRRFRCLHDELRVTPQKATFIIGASMVLHNISINLGMPNYEENDCREREHLEENNNDNFANNEFRDQYAALYFS